MMLGPYRLVCLSYTQESNINYDSEYALLDVYRSGRKITQLAPEKHFYVASQQISTIVAIIPRWHGDLYVVYAGKDPDSGHPIIKVFLNPLVAWWIWIGSHHRYWHGCCSDAESEGCLRHEPGAYAAYFARITLKTRNISCWSHSGRLAIWKE